MCVCACMCVWEGLQSSVRTSLPQAVMIKELLDPLSDSHLMLTHIHT